MSTTYEIAVEEKDELLAFVGENQGYYEMAWFSGHRPKFNGVAFLFSLPWLVFRKMYRVAVLFVAAVLVMAILSAAVLPALPGIIVTVAAMAVCGLFGNRWYLRHCRRIVARVRADEQDKDKRIELLSRRGGTNLFGAIALGVLLLFLNIASAFLR